MKPQNTKNRGSRFDRAVGIFKKHGGILRTAQALRAGIHPGTLYAMRDSGTLEAVSRGVHRLANGPPFGNPDLVTVATRIPGGVIHRKYLKRKNCENLGIRSGMSQSIDS